MGGRSLETFLLIESTAARLMVDEETTMQVLRLCESKKITKIREYVFIRYDYFVFCRR